MMILTKGDDWWKESNVFIYTNYQVLH